VILASPASRGPRVRSLASRDRLRLARWKAARPRLWQIDLLSSAELASFTSERGVEAVGEGDINDLWRLGLLRADFIESENELKRPGLILLGGRGTTPLLYADLRDPKHRPEGWHDALRFCTSFPSGVVPLFHPFRLAILQLLLSTLSAGIHPMQYLRHSLGGASIEELHRRSQEYSTGQPAFLHRLEEVSEAVELAVLSEPYASDAIGVSIRGWISVEEHQASLRKYWRMARGILARLDRDAVEERRRDLCVLADRLDDNSTLYTIARYMGNEQRRKLTGAFGGAMVLRMAAETLRRGCEDAWQAQLPEEDELLHGSYVQHIKQRLYGSIRILDDDRTVREEFVRQQGLDYGTRVRWYVEGDTELAALRFALGQFRPVEFVQLRGAGGLGRREFRDGLRRDRGGAIFSFVLVDADRKDAIRSIRLGIEEHELCGLVCLCAPDLELENFDRSELVSSLEECARRTGVTFVDTAQLQGLGEKASSGSSLLEGASLLVAEGRPVRKGALWGRVLMEMAFGEAQWTPGLVTRKAERPLMQAFWSAVRSIRIDYHGQKIKQAVTIVGDGSAAAALRELSARVSPRT
jgi:hypothetical protein